MKFVHISDLHIGKRLNEYSLIEDQRHILGEIVKIIKEENADSVFIAGDVYDKSVPSAEAVSLLDEFLALLSQTDAKIFIISGNHDSAERIAYGADAFNRQGIYLSPVFDGSLSKAEVEDEYGKVNVYLLPFVKPAHVKRYFEKEIGTYTEAIDTVIKTLNVNENERNIILAHQFVTGAERSESEEVTVGGLDNVDGVVFDKFDYVALGHIHKCQKIKKENIRYSGTPLKYSASEAGDKKCVILGEIKNKGDIDIKEIPLVPMRDFKDLRGNLEELLKSENKKDFVRITLTDEDTLVDAYGKLRENYPYMTELVFDRKIKSFEGNGEGVSINKSPSEQFGEFYANINGRDLTDEQKKLVLNIFSDIKEGRE